MRAQADLLKGALAGVVAGLIASLVEKQFQSLWNTAQKRLTGEKAEGDESQDDPAPVQAADAVSKIWAETPVPEPHREQAGELVHYLTGAGFGGLYGLMADPAPAITAGYGAAYGLATHLVMNEAVVPALGFAPPPTETPLAKHLYSLSSHLVFGLALEGSRRLIRRML